MPRGKTRPTAAQRITAMRDAIVEDACAWADAYDEADATYYVYETGDGPPEDADRHAAAQERRERSEKRIREWVAGLREAIVEAARRPTGA